MDEATARLREITARLGEIEVELTGEGTADERAAELTKEAADLAAEAVEETNRLLRGADAG